MITRRQLLVVPMLPAAGALSPRRSSSSLTPGPAPWLGGVEFVDDHGWVVTAEDRVAIAAVRRERLAATEAAATTVQPASPKPGIGARRSSRGQPRRKTGRTPSVRR